MLPPGLRNPGCPKAVTLPRVLAVEGQTTFLFALDLLRHLGLSDSVEVHNFGGVTDLPEYLRLLVATPGFRAVVGIAVVRDAENDAEAAFASVCSALARQGLGAPRRPADWTQSQPKVGAFILPDGTSPGMLETLCLRAVREDPAMPCVERYFQCLSERGVDLPRSMDKAKVHAFLASRRNPELLLAQAAREGYWPWDDLVFEPLKQFLLSL